MDGGMGGHLLILGDRIQGERGSQKYPGLLVRWGRTSLSKRWLNGPWPTSWSKPAEDDVEIGQLFVHICRLQMFLCSLSPRLCLNNNKKVVLPSIKVMLRSSDIIEISMATYLALCTVYTTNILYYASPASMTVSFSFKVILRLGCTSMRWSSTFNAK